MQIQRIAIALTSLALAVVAACSDDPITTPPDAPPAGEPDAPPPPPDAPPETCFHCGAVATDPDFDPDLLCEPSKPLFEALIVCICGIPEQQAGKCLTECADTVCNPNGGPPSQACADCVGIQCGPETGACFNDE
jgi:hypothetical protein